ncbi:MAG: hypothetical protein J6V99_06495 [Neisseriaceae bacterium]|nr:hypothetical protein [Neisseriaceae bacterium]
MFSGCLSISNRQPESDLGCFQVAYLYQTGSLKAIWDVFRLPIYIKQAA